MAIPREATAEIIEAVKNLKDNLTAQEFADFNRVTRRTVRRWIAEGRLAAVRTSPLGGKLLIPKAALIRFLTGE